eukprot:g15036.t1
MVLFPKSKYRGKGAVSSSAGARKTTPRQNKHEKNAGGRSSPRLHLRVTPTRTQTNARRGAGIGTRVASARQQTSKARGGAFASGARLNGTTTSRGSGGGGGLAEVKKAVQADGVSEVVSGLKGELTTAAETGIEKVEAECDAFVAAALDRCSPGRSGREEKIDAAEATLREMESREASVTSPCSRMLKAIESNNDSLSAAVERCRAILDSIQQAESRRLKSSMDRVMGVKG